MLFHPTRLDGVRTIELEPARDDRGFFARTFCVREFAAHGLETAYVQHSLSLTERAGSIRGMHWQRAPHAESKIVRCLRGAIFDVLVDVRPASPTYLAWEGYELSAENRLALYVPAGVAHGFQTLTANAEVSYQMSAFHAPEAAAGFRYDDPAFAIAWPLPPSDISQRDRAWPVFTPEQARIS
jgi:dTDP-4-dehydrorhamnose 3,5-epimerase